MSMDERTERLSRFEVNKLIYDVPLAATKIELLHDEDANLVSKVSDDN